MSNTIRVIDLLNKIANGEDVPELIEYNGENYIFQTKDYKNEDRDLYLFSEETPDITAALNDEVKIIETIEEQEEIDIQSIEEIEPAMNGNAYVIDNKTWTLNQVIKAVKQLEREINKLKEKE